MIQRLGRILAGLAIAASAALLPACQTNPATGQKFFTTLTPEQEAQIGAEAAPELEKEFGGPVPNTQLQAYVSDIGQKLSKDTESYFPTLQWEFTLLNSPVINAFSLPGGKVFISRGLVEKMTNEAQLAGVLGHEIGHVTAQHVARRIGQQTIFQGALAVSGLAVQSAGGQVATAGQLLMPALNVGGQVMLLKFGRDEESQADYLGIRYMVKAGYDPEGQLQVMEILKNATGAGGGPPEFLSTHPLPQTRIDRIQQLLHGEFAFAVNNPQYKLYPERFQSEFLSVLRKLPPPPAPTPSTPSGAQQQLRGTPRGR